MSADQLPDDREVTYELQYRRCGREHCRCRDPTDNPGHGPYWYAFYRVRDGHGGTRVKSVYVGKPTDDGRIPDGNHQPATNG